MFLSARVPEAVRRRVRLHAATRGESVQAVLARALDKLLAEEDPTPPDLAATLRVLRARQAELQQRGVAGLLVFGSLARGEAGPDSDVDLLVELDAQSALSLTGFARLRQDLAEWLGRKVDMAEWDILTPEAAASARRDHVRVF